MNYFSKKSFTMRQVIGLLTIVFLGIAVASYGGQVTGLMNFAANTTIKASEVNNNFSQVKNAVDDNHSRIAALETTIAALQTQLTTAQNDVAALNALLSGVSRVTLNQQPTVRFSGVNVQVVNGLDSTTTVNGSGNLIVGYDAVNNSLNFKCSNGAYDNQTDCQSNSGTWAVSHKTGSHNLIVGDQNNYSQYAGVVFGYRNTSNRGYSSVSGGYLNTARGMYSSVSGGYGNTASGLYSSVSGGYSNTASGLYYSSVSGGSYNTASGGSSSVSGGAGSTASGDNSSVSGGYLNTASGGSSSVSGGYSNTANGVWSSVSGGNNCDPVADDYRWVVGTLIGGCSATLGN